MKILIIRNYPSFMDVRHNTYNIQEIGLARALVKKGHFCNLVLWTKGREFNLSIETESGNKITVFYRNSKVILKNVIYPNLDALIAKYDVVQLAEYNQVQTWQLAQKYPGKVVVYHGPYYSHFNKKYNLMCKIFGTFFLNKYLKSDTKFIVKSNLAKNYLLTQKIKDTNISVAGVGIDLDSFLTDKSEKAPDIIYGIDAFENSIRLLYVGKFEPRRNIPFLYNVIKLIRDAGMSVKLVEIGDGNLDYMEMCNNYAKKIGISENLYHIDKLEQKYLPQVYQKCDFFLLPSHYEIFGMVLLEAMYYGLPTFTTDNGGSNMLIENDKNGFVLKLDEKEWAQKIITLANDRALCKKISQNAKECIRKHYTWDSVAEGMLSVYQAVGDKT